MKASKVKYLLIIPIFSCYCFLNTDSQLGISEQTTIQSTIVVKQFDFL